ncbi:MAG: EutN/CcmL family microcompartment protein [Acidobacteria bacterium]|nr:EutN/CcmL family microcompartment protein [Acidobacteriota bacterium]
MLQGRVFGNVVSTQKNAKYEGAKLLLVQPITAEGESQGTPILAIDSVGAGIHERVLVVLEGRAAGEALRRKMAPVDSAIVGIIDRIDVTHTETRTDGASSAPAVTGQPAPKKTRRRMHDD